MTHQHVAFQDASPGTLRIVYTGALQGPYFQQATTYGIEISRRIELTFQALPNYPGNESLQLYLQCDLPNNDDVNYYKFCELALRRMHYHNHHTVPLNVDMLDSLAEELRDYYKSLQFDFGDLDRGVTDNSDELLGMITHANDLALGVLQQFQDYYDADTDSYHDDSHEDDDHNQPTI